MKLNLDILYDRLPKKYRAERYGPVQRQLLYSRPIPFDLNSLPEPGRLYIAAGESLPFMPINDIAMISVGEAPRNWMNGNIPLLVLKGTDNLSGTIHDIFVIYDKFDQWDDVLRSELEKYPDFDITLMLMHGCECIKNFIGISDSNLHFLFGCDYICEDNGICYAMLQDPITIDQSSWEIIRDACNIERKIREPYFTDAQGLAEDVYCFNVYFMDVFRGNIYIKANNHPFLEGDFPLMDRLFEYLGKALCRYTSLVHTENPLEIDVVRNLLDGKDVNNQIADSLVAMDDNHYYCFRMKEKRNGKVLPIEYMFENTRSIMPQSIFCTIFHDYIIGLIRVNYSDKTLLNSKLAFLGEVAGKMGYVVGVSNAFTDLRDIKPYYHQACYVSNLAVLSEKEPHISYFSDHTLQYILSNCVNDMPLESIIPSSIILLSKIDAKKGSEYIKTLESYLRNETNASKTAKDLFIHRSSLVKRIDKIKSITGLDIKDADVRLLLRISLWLLEKNK